MPGDEWLAGVAGHSQRELAIASSFADPGGVRRSLTAFSRVQKSSFSLSEEKFTSRVNLVRFFLVPDVAILYVHVFVRLVV